MSRAARAALLILVVFLLPACGSSTSSVSGEVTFDGRSVEKGYINFLPVGGNGPAAGGPIAGGKYAVTGLVPGKKLVQIIGVKAVPFARSSAEMAKRAKEDRDRGDETGLIDPADEISEDAVGNNATVELQPGQQELSFHLKKPAQK